MSNYLAQGLQQGFGIGSQLVSDIKRRKFEEEEAKRRVQAELDRDAQRARTEKLLQDDRIAAEAQRQFNDLSFRGGESEKDRGYRTSEREATQRYGTEERLGRQGFESGERGLDRGLTRTEGAANRASHQGISERQLAQDMEKFKQTFPLQVRHQDWQENPDNPYNRIRDAQAEKLGNDYGSLPPVGGQFTPKAPPPEAIDMLRKNPQLKTYFEAKYGAGSAARYLGQ